MSSLMLDFFTLEIFYGVISSVSASVDRREWLLMAIMAINGYCQNLYFFGRDFFLFIYYLFIKNYQSMIKYNNVNIWLKGEEHEYYKFI